MSNYVKSTDFASKDDLTTGNPLKLIKGSEINTEFNNLQTAIATKADLASPAFTGNPTAATQLFGNSSSRLATTEFVQLALASMYPVGSIYISILPTNPNTLFGFGTWVAFAAGRTLVGLDSSDSLFDVVEETGGSKDAVVVSHTHTVTDPGHNHIYGKGQVQNIYGGGAGGGVAYLTTNTDTTTSTTGITIDSTGVSGTNANIQPYITVYMWKRTA